MADCCWLMVWHQQKGKTNNHQPKTIN